MSWMYWEIKKLKRVSNRIFWEALYTNDVSWNNYATTCITATSIDEPTCPQKDWSRASVLRKSWAVQSTHSRSRNLVLSFAFQYCWSQIVRIYNFILGRDPSSSCQYCFNCMVISQKRKEEKATYIELRSPLSTTVHGLCELPKIPSFEEWWSL